MDDDIDDDGERVRLALGAPPRLVTNGATAAATVSITDNDTRGVTVRPTSLRILEGSHWAATRWSSPVNPQPTSPWTIDAANQQH